MMRLRRRLLPLALLALVLVALPLSPVRAQIPMIANGVITATNASVNVANTTSEQLLFQYPIPAALMASWTTTNAAFASTPLHLVLLASDALYLQPGLLHADDRRASARRGVGRADRDRHHAELHGSAAL